MDGRLVDAGRERTTVSTTDKGTRTERVIQQPSGASWQDVGRVVTTEARQPDGTMLRETIEEDNRFTPKQRQPPSNRSARRARSSNAK